MKKIAEFALNIDDSNKLDELIKRKIQLEKQLEDVSEQINTINLRFEMTGKD